MGLDSLSLVLDWDENRKCYGGWPNGETWWIAAGGSLFPVQVSVD